MSICNYSDEESNVRSDRSYLDLMILSADLHKSSAQGARATFLLYYYQGGVKWEGRGTGDGDPNGTVSMNFAPQQVVNLLSLRGWSYTQSVYETIKPLDVKS